MKIAPIFLVTALLFSSAASAETGVIDQFFSIKGRGNNDIADNAAWNLILSDPKNEKRLFDLFELAKKPDHPVAQNYAGCMLANGYLVKMDKANALKYFQVSAAKNPLALYNWGVTAIVLNDQDPRGLQAVKQAFENPAGRYKEAGDVILLDQMQHKDVDGNLVNLMLSAQSPLAFYLKALEAYNANKFPQAINIASRSAEMLDMRSFKLLSAAYEKLIPVDRINSVNSKMWGHVYNFYNSNKTFDELALGRSNFTEQEDLRAYNEALNWIQFRDPSKKIDYYKALCVGTPALALSRKN